MGGVSVAGFRPGFGLGGMTHSLLVMVSGPEGPGEAILAAAGFRAADGFGPVAGRIAIRGVVDTTDAAGELADAGVKGALPGGEVAEIGSDNCRTAASISSVSPDRAVVSAAAMAGCRRAGLIDREVCGGGLWAAIRQACSGFFL